MKPKHLFKDLLIVTILSVIHVLISVALLERLVGLNILEILLVGFNIYILLRYFTYTIQYILRHRLAKNTKKDNYFAVNILLGIIVNALLLYGLFIMIVVHISELFNWVLDYL